MERIGDIAKKIISNCIVEEDIRNDDIEVVWSRIVDENLRGHTYVNNFKKDILYIKVDSSCYLSILNMKKEQIIKKLKSKGFRIKKIVFRL